MASTSHLESLPMELLQQCVSQLSTLDLGSLAIVNKEFHNIVSSCSHWEQVCKQRWPLSCFSCPEYPVAPKYSSHYQLFCVRMSMEPEFIEAVDMLHVMTAAFQTKINSLQHNIPEGPVKLRSYQSVQMLLSEFLQLASTLQACISKRPELKQTKEYRVLSVDTAWWLEEQIQVLLQHAKSAERPYQTGEAIKNMLKLCMPGMVHPSVINRLMRV